MAEPRILILGGPGAGKGTQSRKASEEFNVKHITTGELLRANKDRDISEFESEYDVPRTYMDQGELVPDEVVTLLVKEALSQVNGFVLDGYPRNVEQAEELNNMTDVDVILYLDVDEEELVQRLTGRRIDPKTGHTYHIKYSPPEDPEVERRLEQRDDDTEETVRERLRVFRETTEPVIEYYEERGQLERVDGKQSPDEVWVDVRKAVENAQ